jgi:O-acetyl-ADP-ribose deacetylase (regulator of RNase III)
MDTLISNQGEEANREILKKVTLVHGDITAQAVDGILAPVPYRQKAKSQLDEAIRAHAGAAYSDFLDSVIDDQKPGFCVIAPSGNLPSRMVFACITPQWQGGFMGEDRALLNCFEHACRAAMDEGARRIAVPIFLTGSHGYPKPRAIRLAVKSIMDTVDYTFFDEIRFVAFKPEIFTMFEDRLMKYGWSPQILG